MISILNYSVFINKNVKNGNEMIHKCPKLSYSRQKILKMFLVQSIKDRKIYISNADIPTPGTDSCQDLVRSYKIL